MAKSDLIKHLKKKKGKGMGRRRRGEGEGEKYQKQWPEINGVISNIP